jgi:type IV pilus assembly protein PilM
MEDQSQNPAVGDEHQEETLPVAPAPAPVPEPAPAAESTPRFSPPEPSPVADPWAKRPAPTLGQPAVPAPVEPAAAGFAEPWREPETAEVTPLPPLYDPVSAPAPVVDWAESATPKEAATEVSFEPATPVAEKSVPFWKRELSFGGKSKPRAVKAATLKKPLLKRELRLGRLAGATKTASKGKRGKNGAGTTKKIVGLTIGSAQITAAEVVNNGHAEVVKVAQRPLERGTVVGGELRDVDKLAAELKEFFKEHRLPQRGVRLGIASNRIGVRIIEVDGVEGGKQLENAVRFRAQEVLPIPIDQAVLDHIVLEEREVNGVVSRRILLVVAYRESVDRYVTACESAGIKLVGIDLEAFGLLRALGKPKTAPASEVETADVVVALGHDRSILAVSANGVCEFTRVFEWGGFALDVAVARELDLTPSAAEPTRTAIGVGGPLVPGGLNPEHAAAARAAMQRQLHGFARELVSSLQFYQDQPNSLGFGEIVLAGGLAQTAGIDQELQRLIGVPVRVGNPLDIAKHGKRIAEHQHLPALAGAIGLGMEV